MVDKVLICGDSFAADWTVKYSGVGWPNQMADNYRVTNLAQAGVGEYKIYQQLVSQNLNDYDFVIVSHTSPYRLHTQHHPVHATDPLHKNCDFLYEDVRAHKLKSVVEYFERYYDLQQARFVHSLICKQIDELTRSRPVLHLAHIKWSDLYQFPNFINFKEVHQQHPGNINHYSSAGNEIIYSTVVEHINISATPGSSDVGT